MTANKGLKRLIWGELIKLFPDNVNTSIEGFEWMIYKGFKIISKNPSDVEVLDTFIAKEYETKFDGSIKILPYYNISNGFTLKKLLEQIKKDILDVETNNR